MGESAARPVAAATGANSEALLDRFLESYYRLRPVNATFAGVHQFDGELPDWSPEGLERAVTEMRSLRQDLAALADDALAATDPAALDIQLADAFLEVQLAEIAGGHFQRGNPALWTGEAVFSIVGLMLRPFAPAVERAAAIERRLGQIGTFLGAVTSTMGRSRPIPAAWVERGLLECRAAKRLLSQGLPEWCRANGIPGHLAGRLEAAAGAARPAFNRFIGWLRRRPGAGYDGSACGEEFFNLLLRRGHFERRPTTELLRVARDQFEDALQRLHLIASRAAAGGWPGVEQALAARRPPAAHYLAAFERGWHECRARSVEHNLVAWPDARVRYVELPEWARPVAADLYFLHYRSPAPHDPAGPTDYLVPALGSDGAPVLDTSVVKLNHVVHHGALGHHVQNFHAYRSASRLGRIAAVDCASRISMFQGGSMAEGWACYATDLAEEVGLLDHLERVAQQYSRVRQLARAIVDIELHAARMGHAEAVQFHIERLRMPEQAAAREVTRTSMFPGTAIMYWLGTDAIHGLRRARERVEGSTFSRRAFHDGLLRFGSMPVNMVAACREAGTPQ